MHVCMYAPVNKQINYFDTYIYIHIYIYIRVCVCVYLTHSCIPISGRRLQGRSLTNRPCQSSDVRFSKRSFRCAGECLPSQPIPVKTDDFPMSTSIFLWFSYGFPMVFLWFSRGYQRIPSFHQPPATASTGSQQIHHIAARQLQFLRATRDHHLAGSPGHDSRSEP